MSADLSAEHSEDQSADRAADQRGQCLGGAAAAPRRVWRAAVRLSNPPDAPVAFFVRLQLLRPPAAGGGGGGEGSGRPQPPADRRILPVLWSDNYVTLAPGEAMTARRTRPNPYPQTINEIIAMCP